MKDILSGLVRVWPVLYYTSLVARLTHKHMFLTVSHHPSSQITLCLPPVTQPRQKRIYRHLVIYHHQGQWPATEKNSKDIDRTTVGVGVAFTAVREEKI